MQTQRKGLPVELLVDIFNATDCTLLKLTSKIRKNDECSTLKRKEFEKLWIYYVNNLLTSSSIVYVSVGNVFKKRWRLKEINKLMDEKIAMSDEKIAKLEERIAIADEKIRKLNNLEQRKNLSKRRLVAEEDGPIAKRTRSHYASTSSKNGKKK
uniref:F-box domain-containing protein n=1 Tax=Meloidogyne hapla TaxID=6305 RepID=A0A1I8BTH4_MELHA